MYGEMGRAGKNIYLKKVGQDGSKLGLEPGTRGVLVVKSKHLMSGTKRRQ